MQQILIEEIKSFTQAILEWNGLAYQAHAGAFSQADQSHKEKRRYATSLRSRQKEWRKI